MIAYYKPNIEIDFQKLTTLATIVASFWIPTNAATAKIAEVIKSTTITQKKNSSFVVKYWLTVIPTSIAPIIYMKVHKLQVYVQHIYKI